MEYMCAQTRPQFVLFLERVLRNGVRTHVDSRGKILFAGGSEVGEPMMLHHTGQRAEHATYLAIVALDLHLFPSGLCTVSVNVKALPLCLLLLQVIAVFHFPHAYHLCVFLSVYLCAICAISIFVGIIYMLSLTLILSVSACLSVSSLSLSLSFPPPLSPPPVRPSLPVFTLS